MVRTKKSETPVASAVAVTPTEVIATPAPPAPPTVIVAEEVVATVEKKKKTKSKKVVATATVSVEDVLTTPVVVETQAQVPVEVATEAETEAEAEAEMEEETIVTEVVGGVETEDKVEKKKRRVVTKEKLLIAIEDMTKELTVILEAGNHKKLLKQYKVVIADTYRLLKIKTAQKKAKDATNSGFMRPVKPSIALEQFLSNIQCETTVEKPLTRAYLTTLICKYIKDKDLQNPKDRRIIFPDEELKTLFQITEKDTEPLTYYNIQKRLQPLVSKIEEEPVPTPVAV